MYLNKCNIFQLYGCAVYETVRSLVVRRLWRLNLGTFNHTQVGTFLQSDVQTVRSQSRHLLSKRLITGLPAVAADE